MKKSIKWTLVIALGSVFVIGVCIGIYKKNINDRKSVEVIPVTYVSSMGMGSETYTSGIVSSNQIQEIYLEDQQTIKEVFVKDGDQVNAGDKLFSYDTTMLELDMEDEKIQIQQTDEKIKSLKSELQTLKNTNPIKKSLVASNQIYNVKTIEKNNEEAILYKSIGGDSIPYAGDGTTDNPYRFLCTSDVVIIGEFMNQLMGYDVTGSNKEKDPLVAVFEVHKGDVKDGILLSMWTVDGANYKPVNIDAKWNFGFASNEENPPGEAPEPAPEDGYTKAELAKLISEKEEELRNEELNKRESELGCEKIAKSISQSEVLSKVQGVVKTEVSKEEKEMVTQTPYMVVSGGEGFYVTGSISELLLGELKIGDIVTAQVWSESGAMQYTAAISEISKYPITNTDNYYGGGGNTNVSYYPFTVFVKETEGLTNGQYVDLIMKAVAEEDVSSFYIQKSYIREEDGNNYAYVADENNRLVKRYVTIGKIINGRELEIIEGITQEDRIAFPYGKDVKEGVKVKDQEDSYNNFK